MLVLILNVLSSDYVFNLTKLCVCMCLYVCMYMYVYVCVII